MMDLRRQCESCSSLELEAQQVGSRAITIEQLTTDSFQVTNKDYGLSIETVFCRRCRLWQPRYLVSFKDITGFYAGMDDTAYLQSASLRGRSNYRQAQRILKKYLSVSSSILEVGAGSGAVVHLLKNDFKSVEGLEPNRQFCEYARQTYGVLLRDIPCELLEPDARYDAVLAFDVIEHVTSPDNFIKVIGGCLRKGGIAIIVTPDKESLAARLMGKKWWHIRPPHLFYFSDRSFSALLEKNGFEILDQGQFYWTLPLNYLLQTSQKLVFNRTVFSFRSLVWNVKVNLFDSKLYVIRRKER